MAEGGISGGSACVAVADGRFLLDQPLSGLLAALSGESRESAFLFFGPEVVSGMQSGDHIRPEHIYSGHEPPPMVQKSCLPDSSGGSVGVFAGVLLVILIIVVSAGLIKIAGIPEAFSRRTAITSGELRTL